MSIVRGFTGDIRSMPPDIYVNEMPVPQEDNFVMPDFVLGFVGEFDRGPVNEYVYVSETPTRRMKEIAESVLGATSDDGKLGNQLFVHLHQAKAKKAVFVRILGEGYSTACLVLNDRQAVPEPILKIKAKYPGEYANIFTVEVFEGTVSGTFKLILVSDLGGRETYDNLNFNPDSKNYVLTRVNSGYHFEAELLREGVDIEDTNLLPAVIEQTQLAGGSDGSPLSEKDYIGSYDAGTKERSGLKLLELAGKRITDFAYAGFSSPKADSALHDMAEKYNIMSYCGTADVATLEEVVAYREAYDTDFGQMVYGDYYANTGAKISGACLSAIVHATGEVQDSGLAKECIWISGADEELDFDQNTLLYMNQVACFTLKPSETGNGEMGWRMGNDYTLARTDVSGEIITDDENRKVNKRRINSWIENSLFFVAAKWQGKAMTIEMKMKAEIRIRTFLDNLKTPPNKLDDPKIEDYHIEFESSAKKIDAFVQYIEIKHFNTAEWILLNYQGGTNVEITEVSE